MSETQSAAESKWFFEQAGQRKGPFSESEIVQFIQSGGVSPGTLVWKQGFPEWIKIENTDMRVHLDTSAPPPLSGTQVKNTLVWFLAFAPLIGYFLEWMVAGAMHGSLAEIAMANNKYWFVTLVLNIVLAAFDAKQLKDAGHNTDKFKGWVWLIPVYLYQRAKATKQSLAYFIVWIICFVLVVLS